LAHPGQLVIEGLQAADRELLEFGAAVAVMLDRGVIDGKDALAVERADDHRHRIAVEQPAERGFALLQPGDIDAQPDDAAVRDALSHELAGLAPRAAGPWQFRHRLDRPAGPAGDRGTL